MDNGQLIIEKMKNEDKTSHFRGLQPPKGLFAFCPKNPDSGFTPCRRLIVKILATFGVYNRRKGFLP